MKAKQVVKHVTEPSIAIVDAILGATGIPVPAASLTKSIFTTYQAIREQTLTEKIEEYINETKHITDAERKAFLKKLDNDQEEFLKKVIATLDRLDSKEKTQLYGKLMTKTVKGMIKVKDFIKLSSVVEQAFLQDLYYFERNFNHQTKNRTDVSSRQDYLIEDETNNKLLGLGLLKVSYKIEVDNVRKLSMSTSHQIIKSKYSITGLGTDLLNGCFRDSTSGTSNGDELIELW